MPPKMEPIENLPRLPASEVKTRGWRGVMRTMSRKGKVVVTNHNEPEAVILPAAEYSLLLQIAKQVESRTESELETLRRRFDERLAALQATGTGDRLRSVMRAPARLRGRVKAGKSY